uniref:ADP-ribosylation factor-like protein 4C n=2 Tax=Ascaris TaxID=6251 RepID=A0A0M3HNE3_ASCLU
MGQKLSLFDSYNYHVAMLGLDNAGKSTIIYRLKMDHFVQQAPTVGFNCEKFRPSSGPAKGQTFVVWDVGGQEKLRPLWRTYVRQADAVIFVVDSTDRERFEEAHVELANLLRLPDFPSTVPVILLANKQDLPEARSDAEVRQSVAQGIGKRPTHILPCCAVTGDGLDELFPEMHQLILQARKNAKKR